MGLYLFLVPDRRSTPGRERSVSRGRDAGKHAGTGGGGPRDGEPGRPCAHPAQSQARSPPAAPPDLRPQRRPPLTVVPAPVPRGPRCAYAEPTPSRAPPSDAVGRGKGRRNGSENTFHSSASGHFQTGKSAQGVATERRKVSLKTLSLGAGRRL